ncbi:MAG: hypothetical protein ACK2UF_02895 [Candidatus Promineifilaceae bacterium]
MTATGFGSIIQAMSAAPAHHLQKLIVSALLFLSIFAVYSSSRDTVPYSDSRWSVYVALSVIREGNTNLDEYADLINSTPGAALPGDAASVEVGGHLRSTFPLGTPLLAVPVVFIADRLAPYLLHLDLHEHMRRVRDEIAANLELINASLIAAAAAVVIYWTGRLYLSWSRALLLVFIFAFCTSMWSTASRALWQHGPSVLMLSLTLYILLAAEKKPQLVQFAGLPLAYAYVVRPTNSLSVLLITAYAFIAYRRYFLNYLFWSALIAIPFLISNFLIYDNLLAPYYAAGRLDLLSPTFAEALAGNLLSPARGLLIYSPILLFAVYGIYLKIKEGQFTRLDLTLIAILFLHWLVISSFPHWYGGHSFGSRFFTDMLPYLCYFLIPVLAVIPGLKTFRAGLLSALFMILLAISFFIHWRGATQVSAAIEWNWAVKNIVENVDRDPQRLWDWSDAQFLRGLRPARLSALERAPYFVITENMPIQMQLTLVNSGDKDLALEIITPTRISLIGEQPDLGNLVLEGMSSQTFTFAIDSGRLTHGQYSLGGIAFAGRNGQGCHTAGSPLIVPVSLTVSSYADNTPQSDYASYLPVVDKALTSIPVNYFAAPADLLINGRVQDSPNRNLRGLFGTGWYDLEQAEDGRVRWARSPADIYIYSAYPQQVQITATVVTLPPDPAAGESGQGLLSIRTNDLESWDQPVVQDQPFTFSAELKRGWNVIRLAAAAGYFLPDELDAQSSNGREVSFAIKGINITGKETEKNYGCCYP